MSHIVTLYHDREHGIMLIMISTGVLLERIAEGVWEPTQRKGVSISAIQSNLHGFFVRKRDLVPTEPFYEEIKRYLA